MDEIQCVESTALIKTQNTRNAVVSKSDHDGGVCWDSAVPVLVVDRSWNGIDKAKVFGWLVSR
jgi:hypothetical protein